MVDTIVLRIHDLQKHTRLVELLKGSMNGVSTVEKVFDNPENAFKDFEPKLIKTQYQIDRATGRTWEKAYNGKIILPSSHYDIYFFINGSQDFIEFSFSIPKYLYGTNVFQFVPHYFDKGYSDLIRLDLFASSELISQRLGKFLDFFCKRELNGFVDPYDLQIFRIDLCYNKLFNNKNDCLYYIGQLKKNYPAFVKNQGGVVPYNVGFMYVTKNFSFKFYHKGTEFHAKDRHQLRGKWTEAQLNATEQLADCMLRYEISIRNAHIDYVYKQKIFRVTLKKYRRARKHLKSLRHDNQFIHQKTKYTWQTITSGYKQYIKHVRTIEDQVFEFFRASTNIEFSNQDLPFDKSTKRQLFDRKLFVALSNDFFKKLKSFRLSYINDALNFFRGLDEIKDFEQRKHEFKRRCLQIGVSQTDVERLSYSKSLQLLELLRNKTYKDLDVLFSQRVLYRYKKLFKLIGLETNVITEKHVGETPFDWYEYHKRVESVLGSHFNANYFRTSFLD
jgi:hypothetical protein